MNFKLRFLQNWELRFWFNAWIALPNKFTNCGRDIRKSLFLLFPLKAKKRGANQRQSFFDISRLRLSDDALLKLTVKKNTEENLAKASNRFLMLIQ